VKCNFRGGVSTAIVVFALAAGCSGSGGGTPPPKPSDQHPSGSMLVDVDRNLTVTYCDHGNRVYRASGGGQALAVVAADPSCAEPVR